MKKGVLLVLVLLASLSYVVAEPCELGVTLVNQDPYPAQPNNYVELVFQVSGVENPECRGITFEVLENFPFDIDGEAKKILSGSTYTRDYKTEWIIPYRIFIDKDAVDEDEEIEVLYSSDLSSTVVSKKIPIKIEDSIADFEVHVSDYSHKDEEITFEILNIADVDVEAVTIDVAKQDTIQIKGSHRNIIGDIDSNEYTTASFEAVPKDGEINLEISYTDQVGVRRSIQKTLVFDSSYFENADEGDKTPLSTYLLVILIVAIVIWFFAKKRKAKKTRLSKKGLTKL